MNYSSLGEPLKVKLKYVFLHYKTFFSQVALFPFNALRVLVRENQQVLFSTHRLFKNSLGDFTCCPTRTKLPLCVVTAPKENCLLHWP